MLVNIGQKRRDIFEATFESGRGDFVAATFRGGPRKVAANAKARLGPSWPVAPRL